MSWQGWICVSKVLQTKTCFRPDCNNGTQTNIRRTNAQSSNGKFNEVHVTMRGMIGKCPGVLFGVSCVHTNVVNAVIVVVVIYALIGDDALRSIRIKDDGAVGPQIECPDSRISQASCEANFVIRVDRNNT